ncbi:hypothetical protein [Eisenibacter elegans]|jgi:regulator of cell morphogenesis and NO signaling|uniref:hypothetical protein n=1 Tax=Eisenibacter elegans TaxID=997 RepID=UPI00041560FA|nr:hypothetical protein [Eisenibacter elegans]
MRFYSEQTLQELIRQDYSYAATLHQLGIAFYEYEAEETLASICKQKRLDVKLVIKGLEAAVAKKQKSESLRLPNYGVEVIIAYLRHIHVNFIQRRLPYMATLVKHLQSKDLESPDLVKDLQLFFPLFVEEFIEHIHEEEDGLFAYLLRLHQTAQGKYPAVKLFYELDKSPLKDFAEHHHDSDDEMRGVRELTNQYALTQKSPLLQVVLYEELKAFEYELKVHADIEDHVLLPKGVQLETEVRQMIRKTALFN